ncbi:MAG TPA: o-succinylbenzoate synthase [Anaerolineae bacterium]|nr:o-succinylbenzoate synthase [Anaerolineae bacterium]
MLLEMIELRHVRMQLQSPFETSFGIEHERDCLIVRLEAEGQVGWGECAVSSFPGYSYETTGTAWHVLSEFFIPAVLGQRLSDVGDFISLLAGFKGHNMARAGLEMALWDLMGRVEGIPLKQLLGGSRQRVPVGVSVGIQPTTKNLLSTIETYVQAGYQRVKLKIKPGRDLEDLQAARRAFPDLKLQVDANSAYSLEDRDVFMRMDPLGLLLIEQPLAEDDLIDHAVLQKAVKTPLCLDESILSVRHARQALEIGACRVINIKSGRVGGLAEALRIHDLCSARGRPVWCGGMLETGIGRAANLALASLPGFTLPGDISASDRYYAEDIAEPRFQLNADSTIDVPDQPGLGVEVVPEALERVTLRSERFRI